MPKTGEPAPTLKERIAADKLKFLEYYRQLPLQKLAAASIGKDENTITRWKSEDQDFRDQITQARANWALSKTSVVKNPEWLLERVLRDQFSQKTQVEHEGTVIFKWEYK